jgi:hypothetical protein
MKITVINKAKSTKKPQNFCPWYIDDEGGPVRATEK